jgi:hypothetical protein
MKPVLDRSHPSNRHRGEWPLLQPAPLPPLIILHTELAGRRQNRSICAQGPCPRTAN